MERSTLPNPLKSRETITKSLSWDEILQMEPKSSAISNCNKLLLSIYQLTGDLIIFSSATRLAGSRSQDIIADTPDQVFHSHRSASSTPAFSDILNSMLQVRTKKSLHTDRTNRPGNLWLGSSLGNLRVDHRRPLKRPVCGVGNYNFPPGQT
jgi:hypothetical protein